MGLQFFLHGNLPRPYNYNISWSYFRGYLNVESTARVSIILVPSSASSVLVEGENIRKANHRHVQT